jgi:hypothetical protein
MPREVLLERIENTRQWLSSLAIPSGIRSTAFGIVGALAGHDKARCAEAFEDLVQAAAAQLDEASRAELNGVLRELTGSSTPTRPHHPLQHFQPS